MGREDEQSGREKNLDAILTLLNLWHVWPAVKCRHFDRAGCVPCGSGTAWTGQTGFWAAPGAPKVWGTRLGGKICPTLPKLTCWPV
jgi:hypothetical protein